LKLFAVGARTAAAAKQAGFIDVLSADGDAIALIELITQTLPPQTSLLYLAGEDRSVDIAAALAPARIFLRTVEVYRAVAERALPAAALSALEAGTIDGVLHFSRRSAQTFLAAVTAGGMRLNSLNCHHFCLSSQVAEAFAGEGATRLSVASRADEAAVLDLVGHG
jgi:uroporphyrinogen-III synthase